MLTKDHWQVILTRLSHTLRTEDPKQWDTLKRVSKSFRNLIWQIEDNNKLVLYCDAQYPTNSLVVLQEQLDQVHSQKALSTDIRFEIHTTKKTIAIRQLGRQPTHHWAPFLVCDETFQLHFYEFHNTLKSLQAVCIYRQHQAKLTAAISLCDYVVTADAKGYVGIWTPSINKEPSHNTFFKAHEKAVSAIDYITQDIFVTGGDREVKFWKINQLEPIKTLKVNGIVKDIRAKSIDELYILALHKGRHLKLTLHTGDIETQLLDHELDAKSRLLICDELRIATPQKIVGVINNMFRDCFQTVDYTESANSETKQIVSRNNGEGFFSRAGYCGVFTTRLDKQLCDIALSVEPTTVGLMP